MSLSTIADISHPRQSESMNDAVLARAEICDILQHALGGQISFIETARSVNRLVEAAGFDRLSEPFVTFVGIDSETDYIPLGKVRDLWQRDAVEKHRAEWNGQKLGQSNSGSKPVEMA